MVEKWVAVVEGGGLLWCGGEEVGSCGGEEVVGSCGGEEVVGSCGGGRWVAVLWWRGGGG